MFLNYKNRVSHLGDGLDGVVEGRGSSILYSRGSSILHNRGGSILHSRGSSSCVDDGGSCHNRRHSLADGVDKAVLVEVLRESLQGDGPQAAVGRHEVAEGGGQRPCSGARVDVGLANQQLGGSLTAGEQSEDNLDNKFKNNSTVQ